MGLVSSALPGFREIRAPLVAGYIWLLVAWLIVEPPVPFERHLRTHGLGSVADLADLVGRSGTIIAVTTLAYLVGAASRPVASVLASTSRAALSKTKWKVSDPPKQGELYGRAADPIREPWTRTAVGLLPVAAPLRHFDQWWDRLTEDERSRLIQSATANAQDVERTIDLPASLLLASSTPGSQTFGEVDRLVAEADFRLLVAPAVLTLSVVLAVQADVAWIALVLAAAVLAVQGVLRAQDARRIMIQFVALRAVLTAPPIAQFESTVQEVTQAVQSRESQQT
jgi:hypothetical protein